MKIATALLASLLLTGTAAAQQVASLHPSDIRSPASAPQTQRTLRAIVPLTPAQPPWAWPMPYYPQQPKLKFANVLPPLAGTKQVKTVRVEGKRVPTPPGWLPAPTHSTVLYPPAK